MDKNLVIISTILGLILILFFIVLRYSKSKCNKKIEATYLKYNSYTSTGGRGWVTNYAPIFKYIFNGREYINQSFQLLSKKKIQEFIVGKNYNIIINEKKTNKFILDKNIKFTEILILLMGIFFLLTTILNFIFSEGAKSSKNLSSSTIS